MASDRVRIALIGAGRMGQVHLGALQTSDLIDLAAVVEPLAITRERLAATGTAAHETVEELLDADAPDGVLIAAPSEQHPSLVATFAAAGIPMLCEKPVGVRVEDALAAASSAQAAGVLLQVGYWRRFAPELGRLRQRIAGGELGEICQISCMQWDHDLPAESFRARSGGIAVDMGVHEFDQTRWLLGQEFTWVAGTAAGHSTTARPASDPDSATLLARLSGGAAATISLGRHFPHRDSCWVEVWGSEGYARVPFMWDAAGEAVFRESMRLQAEAFARAVRGAPCEGAQAGDAIAALKVAGLAAQALVDGVASGKRPAASAA
jgi:myo-inositol 2-dehydrogenase/D-chiro-inositol 1-dehydrogenase